MSNKTLCVVGAALLLLVGGAGVASAQTVEPSVFAPSQVVSSSALTQGYDDSRYDDHKVQEHRPGQARTRGDERAGKGDSHHDHDGGSDSTTPGTSFPGVGASGFAPPDTTMAIGPNHILQAVNSRYAIYNKSGALLVGPNSLRSLWTPLGSGSGCVTDNGDVAAQYDRLADRFILTQLGDFTAPFSECIAISKTNDPTGGYWLYEYSYGSQLPDYPKFGIWPTATNGAYLATYNLFLNASSFTGGMLCAFDRTKMLAGDPTAQSICYTIAGDGGFLPADQDGPNAPPDGAPGLFVNYETLSSLRTYALKPDFTTPANSTLTLQTPDLAVPAFAEACGGGTCIPQKGTTQKLDSLGDRLMQRLAYRNFGDHEALVVNHSVTAGSSVGVRWYELRRTPTAAIGPLALYQSGTYAPDATYRWMGSAAMDKNGDIAVGYSASSSAINPAIRYAGRLSTDAPGTLGAEVSMLEGTGSQTAGLSRWGDYTTMQIDPVDDCTFWYANEYLTANGTFNWSTYFGSFKFAACGSVATPDFALSASPTSLTLTRGATGNSTVTATALGGFSTSVGLAVTGCPANTTCTIAPSVTPTATAVLSVVTTATTPTGTVTLTVTGTSLIPALTHTTTVSLTVNAPTPTTVTFTSSGSQDGYVLESGEATNVGGTANSSTNSTSGLRVGDDNSNRQYKSVVSFNTASIPDGATITSVTLRLRRGTVIGTNPFTTHGAMWVDVQSGAFSGSTTLQAGDFQAAATAVQAASLSNAASNGSWSEGALNPAGLAAVNKTGTTQLRVYFNLDDNNDSGADYIGYYSGDGSSGNRPQLVVTYQ